MPKINRYDLDGCRAKRHIAGRCVCTKSFCADHRNTYDHSCTFDFIAAWRIELEAMPVVAGDCLQDRL
jgi:hypothetical protein